MNAKTLMVLLVAVAIVSVASAAPMADAELSEYHKCWNDRISKLPDPFFDRGSIAELCAPLAGA